MRAMIIGLGSIAKKHVSALHEIDSNIEVYALRSSKKSVPFKNVISIYDYNEIKSIAPNFIIISNPTALHWQAISKIVGLGKPIFIEKPALSSLEKSDELLESITKYKVLTYVACNLRFLESVIFTKNYLSNKKEQLNEVSIYCGSYLPEWRPNVDYRKVYSANKNQGGGVHLDLIHEIDYAYWFFGLPQKVSTLLRSTSSLEISAIDYAQYSLIYDSFVANITLNYFRRDMKRSAEFVFEDETVTLDLLENKVYNHQGSLLFESDSSLLNTYKSQMNYFLNLVENNNITSMNTFQEGIEVLKICLHNE